MNGCQWFGLLVFCAGGALAAGEESPYEQTIKQMLASLDKISTVLNTIESEESAKEARPPLRKAADTWIEARAKAARMQQPERDEKMRLTKLYKPKLDEALKKLYVEVPRVQAIPGGKEALQEISGVLKKAEK